jgi:hypothetical protein
VSQSESQPRCISKPWPGFEDTKAEFADANELVTASITSIEIVSHRMTIERTSTINRTLREVRDILPSILLQLNSCRSPLLADFKKAGVATCCLTVA